MAQMIKSAATGIAAIDAANDGLRFLLEHLFRPGVECRRGEGGNGHCDMARCARIDALVRYMRHNLGRQDAAMAEAGYPEAERHQGEHDALIGNLCSMRDANVCADKDGRKVHDFLALWTIEHWVRCDQPLGRWTQSRRLTPPRPAPQSATISPSL